MLRILKPYLGAPRPLDVSIMKMYSFLSKRKPRSRIRASSGVLRNLNYKFRSRERIPEKRGSFKGPYFFMNEDNEKDEKCKYCGKKITDGEWSDNGGYCDDCAD